MAKFSCMAKFSRRELSHAYVIRGLGGGAGASVGDGCRCWRPRQRLRAAGLRRSLGDAARVFVGGVAVHHDYKALRILVRLPPVQNCAELSVLCRGLAPGGLCCRCKRFQCDGGGGEGLGSAACVMKCMRLSSTPPTDVSTPTLHPRRS